ncbi:HEAT repeat domain-containing protein [Streptomyces noursei]|uniref:HEAT repeat domain-containing protein n=1 Tax=Streptomyces noursei TaxID=1971 RepID=UPI0036D3DC3F
MSEEIAALVRRLAAESRDDRAAAQDALTALGAPVVPYLLPLLKNDGTPGGTAAELCLEDIGSAALAPLREVRAHGPGALRATALRMLAELGGGDALSDADRSAVERLVRIKLPDEQPGDLPADRWVAVPKAEVADIVDALDLHDARPVTTAMGLSAAVHHENSLSRPADDGSDATSYRVFITPEFEGWRLVYGADYLNENWAEVVTRLSAHCGEAHFYAVDEYDGAWVWWVSENGQDRRGYRTYGDPQWIGEPMEFERDLMPDEDVDPDSEDYDAEAAEEYAEGVRDPEEVASSISVQPTVVEVLDRVGHGWLAVTDPEVGHGRFRGALDI